MPTSGITRRFLALTAQLIVERAQYKSPQQYDCRENWIYAYRIQQFSRNDHPSNIDLYIHRGSAMYRVTVSPRVSQTLARSKL